MVQSILKMPATAPLTADQFYDLCRANPDWKLVLDGINKHSHYEVKGLPE